MNNDIKNDWQVTKFNSQGFPNITRTLIERRRTALQRLASRYRRFSNFALFMIIFWCPLFAFSSPEIPYKPYLAITFAIFFLMCACMDRWLYNGISSIDCSIMSVIEVARRATFYRKRHLQFMIILIPFAACLVAVTICLATNHPGFIMGAIFGLIIGSALGWFQFLRFMKDYKIIRSDY